MADGRSILLVQDDRDIRESILEALADEGYLAIGAIDGLDALEVLRGAGKLPDLILLDLMMPRMTGVELGAELAQLEAWSSIPIVVISADAQARLKSQSLGAVGYLKKPIRLAVLFDLLERILGSRGAT